MLALLSPIRLIGELAEKLFGVYDPAASGHGGFPAAVYVAAALGLILLGIVIMVWRYVPED